jgi:hypothetical protein
MRRQPQTARRTKSPKGTSYMSANRDAAFIIEITPKRTAA